MDDLLGSSQYFTNNSSIVVIEEKKVWMLKYIDPTDFNWCEILYESKTDAYKKALEIGTEWFNDDAVKESLDKHDQYPPPCRESESYFVKLIHMKVQ